ncbi:MAG: hypothetical protein IPO66_11165 [Rhodanobacteraceae bacterium]|nr:hypothetical protein [Rhodanobacteraceae bacterium]
MEPTAAAAILNVAAAFQHHGADPHVTNGTIAGNSKANPAADDLYSGNSGAVTLQNTQSGRERLNLPTNASACMVASSRQGQQPGS